MATLARTEPAAEPAGGPPPLAPALDAAASRGSFGDDFVAGVVLGIATFACLVWAVGWLAALIGGRPPWSLLPYLGVALRVSTAAAAVVAAGVGVIGYRRWRAGAVAKELGAGPAGDPSAAQAEMYLPVIGAAAFGTVSEKVATHDGGTDSQ